MTAAEGQAAQRSAQRRVQRELAQARMDARQRQVMADRGESMVGTLEPLSDIDDGSFRSVTGEGVFMLGDARTAVLFSTVDGTTSRVRIEQLASKLIPDENGDAPFSEQPINPEWKYKIDSVTGMPMLVRPVQWKCLLHPDSPDRQRYDELGLAGYECLKDNIPNRFQQRLHAQRRHPQVWAVLQEAIEDERREEDRRRQDLMLAALQTAQRNREE